ncbi:AMP-dependent synthetase/ligase [Namhaeicola litoreus]|uniref:AMP-dependent synthetase/ligase n=1 Tax=Namhaeicola litoreus TaxID=1052145 RepID=A0ABW3Y2I7_9FLAO
MKTRTIFNMLDRAANTYAQSPYLNQKEDNGWKSTTFSDTRKKALHLSSVLLDLGINYEDKITILSEAKADWIISEFAILYAGAISVPLSIKLLPEEIPFRVNHSDSKMIIVSENTLEKVISQWNKFEYKDLQLVILDKPSKKITEICKQLDFDEKRILYIEDLYEIGRAKFNENSKKLSNLRESITENDVVTICYTSGTTGNPKGIMLTHLNYFSNSHEAVNTFQIRENIRTLLILPTDHSFAHTVGIYTSLVKGLALYFVDARGGGMNALKNIPINLKEANPNFLLTVPALTANFINKIQEGISAKGDVIEGIFERGLKAAIKRNGNGFNKPGLSTQLSTWFHYSLAKLLIFKKLKHIFGSNIEFFVGGGALLDIKQQQFYKAIGIPVYQGYGLTEATPIISTNTPFFHKMGTSGKLLDNIKCKIVDENAIELAKGQKGEIIIKGDNVMKGYYKNEEATSKALKNEWLYTGDLGYFDEDDFLVVVGREKALLISEDGEKYSPEEIEEAIVNSSSFIHQCMIYNDHKKFTTALVTLNKPVVSDWIKKNRVTDSQVILDKVKSEVLAFKNQKEFKNKFPEKWIPSNFQIIEEEFSEANKMINSTLKMVRFVITDTYKEKLNQLYLPNSQATAHTENKKTIDKIFNL